MDTIEAPWTEDQVAALNRYQEGGWMHPFTCGTEGCGADLRATVDGWVCPAGCGYTQRWAWLFMTQPKPQGRPW